MNDCHKETYLKWGLLKCLDLSKHFIDDGKKTDKAYLILFGRFSYCCGNMSSGNSSSILFSSSQVFLLTDKTERNIVHTLLDRSTCHPSTWVFCYFFQFFTVNIQNNLLSKRNFCYLNKNRLFLTLSLDGVLKFSRIFSGVDDTGASLIYIKRYSRKVFNPD